MVKPILNDPEKRGRIADLLRGVIGGNPGNRNEGRPGGLPSEHTGSPINGKAGGNTPIGPFLASARLAHFQSRFDEYGVETVKDLSYLTPEDLSAIGLKRGHQRKLKFLVDEALRGHDVHARTDASPSSARVASHRPRRSGNTHH